MQEKHIPAVVALERNCKLSSRGETGYQKALQDTGSILLVITSASETTVIAIFSAQTVVDELQIDNVAVAEDHRRNGMATSLLAEALKVAKDRGMNSAILEVRASNFAAVTLYEKHGFIIVGRRKEYYQNPLEDALTMTATLCKHA